MEIKIDLSEGIEENSREDNLSNGFRFGYLHAEPASELGFWVTEMKILFHFEIGKKALNLTVFVALEKKKKIIFTTSENGFAFRAHLFFVIALSSMISP